METKNYKQTILSSLVLWMCVIVTLGVTSCYSSKESKAKGKELVNKYEIAVNFCDWGPATDTVVAIHEEIERFGVGRLSKADKAKFDYIENKYSAKVRTLADKGCGMAVFRKHFKGIKLECSNGSYYQRFKESEGKIIMYLKLNMQDYLHLCFQAHMLL